MSPICRVGLTVGLLLPPVVCGVAAEPQSATGFRRLRLTDQFYCEGATAADIDRDGVQDVVAGPFWYRGPDFTERLEIYEPKPFDIGGYSDNFFAFAYDFNGDEWLDVFVIGFPGREASWYENPGGEDRHWQRHQVFSGVDNESPTFADLTGDQRPELVCHTGGRWGYAEIPADPTQKWQFKPISEDQGLGRYNHGLGVGDLNGDGRKDLLEKRGWWEQPESSSAELWEFHAYPFAEAGGAQMLVADLDDDGDSDVVSSKAAHGYGVSWFENVGGENEVDFVEHPILSESAETKIADVQFSQLHALALADMDGDGSLDIVTGKRFWAHQGKDPGGHQPAVSYWFQAVREQDVLKFLPRRIDTDSGVGTQVVVADLNQDGKPDVVVGNKKGTTLLLQKSGSAPAVSSPQANDDPIVPRSLEGRLLNVDFEARRGLPDWTATGAAFVEQPVWGDTIQRRDPDKVSGHIGNHWIGTAEIAGDEPQGTLTSKPFVLSQPYASCFVGGGSSNLTRVEIVEQETDKTLFVARGQNKDQMRPIVADLSAHLGKQVVLRVIDEASGPWGHINFDHFRLHAREPSLKSLQQMVLSADEYPFAGLGAEEAVQAMLLPEGFSATVFATEPAVKQPIAMALDDRGRVWIAEAYEYPQRAKEGQGRDRILIFEDTDNDGRFDVRKVFYEGLNLVSGLEVGFGGVWVGAAPYFMFIPDRDQDDLPDGDAEILLDGWGYQDTHETLNAFNWGPDGWLYGCHGVFTHSRVGKPGTPDEQREPLNAGIWRYHPQRHEFEVFCHGTSNPWGVDFNDQGQAVATACVIPHLFHMIQGARYHRQGGLHFNRYTYDDIKTIADHRHYLGETPHQGNLKSDSVGGGHAHAGAMIYLGGAWPERYRDQIFMNNIHGQRINMDLLKPQGSGLVGSHGPDFLLTQDQASQMLNFRYGPDGQVYIIDWYDMQACHTKPISDHDRSNGRIYKVSYSDSTPVDLTLAKRTDHELAEMMLRENEWYVRHARRLLQERSAERAIDSAALEYLETLAETHSDEARRLRALWTLHVCGALQRPLVEKCLADESPYVRAWAIQLAMEPKQADEGLLAHFLRLAKADPSPVVRLYLASALQRMPLGHRWSFLEALASHSEDADDHNLPLMYWYAAEPLAAADPVRALQLGRSIGDSIPLLREYLFRRVGSLGTPAALESLADLLAESDTIAVQQEAVAALRVAFTGKRNLAPPASWKRVRTRFDGSDNPGLQLQITALGAIFGDPAALQALRSSALNEALPILQRREALKLLLEARDRGSMQLLQTLLSSDQLREEALSGLALFEDPQTAQKLLELYPSLNPTEKRRAVATLASRSSYAVALLEAISLGTIGRKDLSADVVRQLGTLEDQRVQELVNEHWGNMRSTPEEKLKAIESYRELIRNASPADVDLQLGRTLFAKTCQQCHKLFGTGETIGPELTGSNRANLDYLLSNVIDPNAIIPKEYQSTLVLTMAGRVITGIVVAEDEQSLTLRTSTEKLSIPLEEIDERYPSEISMMPENQLDPFSEKEIVSLFAYLRTKSQVPLLASAENAPSLFNGHDLSGWRGEAGLWSVEDGAIVGRSEGLEHNSFLISELSAEDFEFSMEVRLVANQGNSGVQFRSRPLQSLHEIFGYQADIGPDWWGKLYEEHGRALLWKESGEAHVQLDDWNEYRIRAQGSRIQTWLNGQPCVDLDDPEGRRRGVFAFQLHSGGPSEVRFRDLKLQVLNSDVQKPEESAQ